jgi:hypothetical protein
VKRTALVGGRYDGFLFEAEGEGFRFGDDDWMLVLSPPPPADWEAAWQAALKVAGAVPTTTLAPVPFRTLRTTLVPEDVGAGEVYLRGRDGKYRTPALARCS